ncbi:hypothetical protein HNY73_017080 [Argiope bruennichi]|uniref:Uncharacterized protein n=1 Tax=Argiope bruennichi TaxID=94029 RepID=A0A8T0EKN8_ARGBR|nr:hypothetical protein HNY73_017080 [Argiope bruennichi]
MTKSTTRHYSSTRLGINNRIIDSAGRRQPDQTSSHIYALANNNGEEGRKHFSHPNVARRLAWEDLILPTMWTQVDCCNGGLILSNQKSVCLVLVTGSDVFEDTMNSIADFSSSVFFPLVDPTEFLSSFDI